MLRLVASRLLGGLFVVVAVAVISFFLLRAAPGGPFDAERNPPPEVLRNIEERYHLNDPLSEQLVSYLKGVARLDFGHSMKRQKTVNELIADHVSHSVTLGVMALLIATGLGIAAGVTAAWRRNTWVDHLLMAIALVGVSVPSFVLGPLFIYWLSLKLNLLPPARAETFAGYLMPALTLGLIYAGTIARLARTGMIETLGQDFIRTARAKGLGERTVVWKHALRLGLIPVVTYLGPATAALISGSFVVEHIFQVPGLGYYFVDSVGSRDYPVLTGLLVFYVTFLVLLNLAVDIAYGFLDPRIRARR